MTRVIQGAAQQVQKLRSPRDHSVVPQALTMPILQSQTAAPRTQPRPLPILRVYVEGCQGRWGGLAGPLPASEASACPIHR